MPEIHGNIEGIRKSLLDELATLYDIQLDAGSFLPQDIMNGLCGYSASMNREIALYITRYGEISDIIVGKTDHVNLPETRLRRSENRLSMIRCIHTHPGTTGELSSVDITALLSMRFDAMCAIGVHSDGHPTSVQCAFLEPDHAGQVIRTELLNARKLPQEEWLDRIDETDAAYLAAQPELHKEREKAVLVGIESESSLNELAELAATAGADTLLKVLQKRPKPDGMYCIGRGKAEELSLTVQSLQADLVIFDEELTGVMQKNLEEALGVKVIDRTALILDIFAKRANTREGKLQVEMAQLQYRSQRLLGQGLVLSRLAGGIGTRGPGESKLEVSRRRIRERLTDLGKELAMIEKQRSLRRQSREKNSIPIVSLVGYTNAGKSTLFNRLTGAEVYVEDQLFATLDSVSRPVTLPHGGKILLVDTVGFIRKLPHDLVKAFRATLEEAKLADVLLLVSDGADSECLQNHATVEEVLASLGATEASRINVLNKADLFPENPDFMPGAIRISAKEGLGLELLLNEIEKNLSKGLEEVSLLVPFEKYALISRIRTQGNVLSESFSDRGAELCLQASEGMIQYLIHEGAVLLQKEIGE